ncbi:MAG: cbb3-type cytochrome oxidase assembly protein CcoS [Moraxellaceae bacterium]
MEIIYLLVPLSMIFLLGSIWAIRYAVRSHQFDDLDNAAQRIILDDREAQRQAAQRQAVQQQIQADQSTHANPPTTTDDPTP